MFSRTLSAVLTLLGTVTVIGSMMGASPAPTTHPTTKPFQSIDNPYLHNAHIVTDRVISGAQPEGDEGFEALRDLGVKTIISVDGAKPDAERARKFGMRYIHLPIGYDGVDAETGLSLAKAISEMPAKIYIHCHHGKHRSAAATAVACVLSGSLQPDQADDVLQTFGTGLNYKGLWRDARQARPVDPAELRNHEVEYVEAANIGDLAEHMVAVDQHWEHVKALQKNRWQPLADHPDLDPAHEALQLQEHFHESGRLPSTAERPADFRKFLSEAETNTIALREALSFKPVDAAAADGIFNRIAADCTACHKAYRD